MKLYHCRDTRSLRALWALEECGMAYELVKMPFPPRYSYEGYLDVNPLGTVPALDTGEILMTESAAICQYLADVSNQAQLRIDSSDREYAAYLNWLHRSDATFTFPLTLVLRYGRFEKPENRLPQVVNDYTRWFLKRMEVVETALGDADYLCGNRFTMADICVAYAIYLAEQLDIASGLGRRTRNYLERLMQRPAFQRTLDMQSEMARSF